MTTERRAPVLTRSRRLFRAFALLAIAMLGFLAVGLWLIGDVGHRRLDAAIAEADLLDPGWRLAELEAKRRPAPTDEKNGLRQIALARAALPKILLYGIDGPPKFAPQELFVGVIHQPPTVLNELHHRDLRADLALATEAVARARKLIYCPYGRDSVDSSRQPFRFDMYSVANALRLDALLRAQEKDLDGAILEVRAMLAICRAIDEESSNGAVGTHMRIAQAAVSMLEQALALGEASDTELSLAQEQFLIESENPNSLIWARGNRANMHDVYEQERRQSYFEYRKARLPTLQGSTGALQRAKVEFELLQEYLSRNTKNARNLRFMTQVVEISKLPAHEQLSGFQTLEKDCPSVPSEFKSNVATISRAGIELIEPKAQLRAAAAAVAAERFRLATGRWPTEFMELVPRFLSAVPLDPYDGASLRLKRRTNRLIVYSIGTNLNDDNGEVIDMPNQSPLDIGFILYDVSSRRQPASATSLPSATAPGKMIPAEEPRK